MNQLAKDERIRVIAALVEGNSIRAASRMTGVARNTVTKLLVDLGQACMKYHDRRVRNIRVRRLQCDEIWSYVGAKAKNVKPAKKKIGWGDVWTWVGIDADTKLVVSYLVGGRGADWAMDFMQDCASRIRGRVQITTDGHRAYLEAVEGAFGMAVDYAQLHKIYGASLENETRYSPAVCIGCDMRRFTRLTNAFSKKIDNHAYAVALHFMYCNFVRIHQTLRVTPAMEAALTDHAWTIEEVLTVLEVDAPKQAKRGPSKKRISN